MMFLVSSVCFVGSFCTKDEGAAVILTWLSLITLITAFI